MNQALSLGQRVLTLQSPLGDDLWVTSLRGTDGVSILPNYELECLSHLPDLDANALLGEPVLLTLECQRRALRYFHGVVVSLEAAGRRGMHWRYIVRLSAKLWFAGTRGQRRLWTRENATTVVGEVLDGNGIHHEWRLKRTDYRVRDLITQGRESDLNLILRLLESEGICFYFRCDDPKTGHIMVLVDHFSSHLDSPITGYAEVPYYPPDDGLYPDADHFDAWQCKHQAVTGHYEHSDYDFRRPRHDLTVRHSDQPEHLFGHNTWADFAGEYTETGDGQTYAQIRLEEAQQARERISLGGNARGVVPGYCFTLTGHPDAARNKAYLVLRAAYGIVNNDHEGSGGTRSASFHVDLEAMPADRQFRPARITPKPRANGPETAVVVGPEGAIVHTNQDAMLQVQPHWSRDGRYTYWVRKTTPWAGSNFGMIALPRVGTEVLIEFVNGDIDSPIATSGLFNGDHMPPWDLPANASQSGILSRSLGGGYEQANAIRFEDLPGKEQLWLRSQKDKLDEVEHDERHWVGNDRQLAVDRDETTKIGRDRSEDVGRHETILIHGDRKEEIDGEEAITLHKSRTTEIDDNEALMIHKDRQSRVDWNEILDVGLARTMTVGASETLTVGQNKQDTIAQNWAMTMGQNWSVNVAQNKSETIAKTAVHNVGLGRMDTVGAAYGLNVSAAMNTIVGMTQTTEVGMAKSTIVGTTYTLSVGGVAGEGGSSIIMTAESITQKVGDAELALNADGTITINGKIFSATGSEHVQISSKVIDNN